MQDEDRNKKAGTVLKLSRKKKKKKKKKEERNDKRGDWGRLWSELDMA